jgi:hypothetical protein
MRFKELTESYIKIDDEKIRDIVKSNLTVINDYCQNKQFIYRGMKTSNIYEFGTTADLSRRASNTYNIVNKLTEVLPSWQDWPKRTKSFICSTSISYTKGYGQSFRVIPLKHTGFAISNREDFWYMLPNNFPGTVSNFNEIIHDILLKVRVSLKMWDIDPDLLDDNPLDLIDTLDKISNIYKNNQEIKNKLALTYNENLLLTQIANKGIKEFLNTELDPNKNGKLIYEVSNLPTGMHEVWFEGEALFINDYHWLEFKKVVNEISRTFK